MELGSVTFKINNQHTHLIGRSGHRSCSNKHTHGHSGQVNLTCRWGPEVFGLQALERICNDAGFATSRQQVLTSEGSRHADLEIRNIWLADKVDLLVDVTIRHDFIGDGRSGLTQGQLRNPDKPDRILESATTDKIRNYRDAYAVNRQVAFLPACMSTSGPHPL